MTMTSKATTNHIYAASIQTHDHRIRNAALKAGRFSLHLQEMTLAMMAGMVLLIPA